MKKIFLLSVLCMTAGLVSAQNSVEIVITPPVYGDENFVDPSQSGTYETSDSNNIGNEVVVTTEAGTSTYSIATSTTEDEEPIESLSDVVSRINDQYDAQKAQCETGSWLARVWCKISSWF